MGLVARRGMLRSLLTYYGVPFRLPRIARFYRQFIQPGDLCFDIGAHVGNRLRALLNAGGRVVAVEPQSDFMCLLTRLFGQNSAVTLIEAAVGAAAGEADMLVSRRTPTVTTLSRAWTTQVGQVASFAGVRWDAAHKVSVTTLDALIARFGVPAFCKIDVEGYELEVLQGVSRPLRWMSFEYIPATRGQALACLDRLSELGDYTFNWTVGERPRFESQHWFDASAMASILQTLTPDARSGDIYAHLKDVDAKGATHDRSRPAGTARPPGHADHQPP